MSIVTSRSYAVSLAAVVVAAGLCVVAVARAVTVEPIESQAVPVGVVSTAERNAPAGAPVARVPSEGVLGMQSLALAVDHDPFMPDRRRAEAYRLPTEFTPRPVVTREEEVDPPPFRVVGTATMGETGMALVQPLEAGAAIDFVNVGSTVQGYRLAGVDNESATLVMRDRTFRLGIQAGSATGADGRTGPETQAFQQLLRALQERGMSEAAAQRLLNGNANAVWSVDGQVLRFSNGNGPVGEFRVEVAPTLPFGRAGRAGRGGRGGGGGGGGGGESPGAGPRRETQWQ